MIACRLMNALTCLAWLAGPAPGLTSASEPGVGNSRYHLGDRVVVMADSKLAINGNQVTANVWPGLVLTVGDVNGSWLWVSNGHPGWLDQRHVVPLDRKAIEQLTIRINRTPNDARLYNGRGEVWKALEDYESAIQDYTEVIRLRPTQIAGYGNRAAAKEESQDYGGAVEDFTKAIRIDPTSSLVYNGRGNAWRGKGEKDRAIADYSEAIRRDPDFVYPYVGRAEAWFDKSEYGRAMDDLNEAIRLDEKYAPAFCVRGRAWDAKGEFGRAIADFTKAIQIDPKLSDAYSFRAWLRATCRDSIYRDGSLAVADATKACELTHWKDSNNLGTLAAAYAEEGDFAKAVEWQTKALALVPAKHEVDFRSRLTLYQSGQPYRMELKPLAPATALAN